MRQHSRIPDQIHKDVPLSGRQFVQHYACRFYEPKFREKPRFLAAQHPDIQCILFDASGSQDSHFFERMLEALIAFCWSVARSQVLNSRLAPSDSVAKALETIGRTVLRQNVFF